MMSLSQDGGRPSEYKIAAAVLNCKNACTPFSLHGNVLQAWSIK